MSVDFPRLFAKVPRGQAGGPLAYLRHMATENSQDDRRDGNTRDVLLAQLRAELRHVPGIALTTQQASRLFNLPADTCERLIESLAQQGVVEIRPDGRFVTVRLVTAG